MLIGGTHGDTASRRACDKAELEQIGFVYVLNRLRIFARAGGQRVKSHGTTVEFLDDREQHIAVRLVQSDLVDLQRVKCGLSYVPCNHAVGLNLSIITHTFEQAVDDTWSPSRTTSNLFNTTFFGWHSKNAGRAARDFPEGGRVVIFHAIDRAEAVT